MPMERAPLAMASHGNACWILIIPDAGPDHSMRMWLSCLCGAVSGIEHSQSWWQGTYTSALSGSLKALQVSLEQ